MRGLLFIIQLQAVQSLSTIITIVPTLFPFTQIITAYFWETVSTRYKIMNWLTIIIVVAIIAGILGALNSKDGEKGEGFFSGALAGGMGCGYVIFEIFLVVGGLILLFKLFGFLFG